MRACCLPRDPCTQWLAYARQDKKQAQAQQARWLQVLARHAELQFETAQKRLKGAVEQQTKEVGTGRGPWGDVCVCVCVRA